jgi:hypothetical protein
LPARRSSDLTAAASDNWIGAIGALQYGPNPFARKIGRDHFDLFAELIHDGNAGVHICRHAIIPLRLLGTEASACHLTWDDEPLKKGRWDLF